jgi:hypothetical protein
LPRATACGFFRFLSIELIIRARLRMCKRNLKASKKYILCHLSHSFTGT